MCELIRSRHNPWLRQESDHMHNDLAVCLHAYLQRRYNGDHVGFERIQPVAAGPQPVIIAQHDVDVNSDRVQLIFGSDISHLHKGLLGAPVIFVCQLNP
jgi:hypothetical protein